MAQKSSSSRSFSLLPEGSYLFIKKRLVELGGFALFALTIALAVALATFNSGDPTLNQSTGAKVANLLGLPGAYAADIVLQSLGLACVAVLLALAAWSWRIVSHRGLPWGWWNLALAPLAIVLVAIFAATFPAPANWPLRAGPGGIVGDLAHGWLLSLADRSNLRVPLLLQQAVLTVLALPVLILSFGMSISEWIAIFRGGMKTGRWMWHGTRSVKNAAADAARSARVEPDMEKPARAESGRDRRDRVRKEPSRRQEAVERPAKAEPPRPQDVRIDKRKAGAKQGKRAAAERQPALDLAPSGEYQLPPLSLLEAPPKSQAREPVNEEALQQNARLLESVLDDYGIKGEITRVRPGPVVTLYELEPAPGVKSARVIGLADDIARSMSAISARIAVIPGRNAIGIELPNRTRETVFLRELLSSSTYENTSARLTLALGKDIGGTPIVADLARMPHLLIAGTTGSGKSVAINTMILSLLYRLPPEQCRLILIDPKMLELSVYDGIPHLLAPVVTEPGKAVVALKWAVREMEDRYRKMAELGVRNIAGYNQRLREAAAKGETLTRTVQTGFDSESGEPLFEDRALDTEPLPLIVVVVDEMADLMMVAGKDIEAAVQRLAQMARAAGIHLVMATQRPSVDVITGTIKANFPTRISFQVTSKIDSRTVLGEQGAEQLLGQGDMLFMPGAGRIQRVHGPFVSDDEVERVVSSLREQGAPEYRDEVTEEQLEGPTDYTGGQSSGDELYDQAVAMVCRERKASTSFIQRHFSIGYNRAARIIDRMEAEGVVSRANHVGKREVLARDIDDRET